MKLSVSLLGCEVFAVTWGDEWEEVDEDAATVADLGYVASTALDAAPFGFRGRWSEIPGDDTE